MRKLSLIVFLAVLFLPSAFIHADAPIVTSFTASPTSISHNNTTVLSWSIDGGNGANLYFFCSSGVSVKSGDGSTFSCNTSQPFTSAAFGSATFFLLNISGSSQQVKIRFIPKDYSGNLHDSNAAETTVTVAAAQNPITNFATSSTTPMSGKSITLSWTGTDLGGINLQFECASGLRMLSSSPPMSNPLTCGVPAYSPDLPATGSVTLSIENDSVSQTSLTIKALPAITPGSYDGTHAALLTMNVQGKLILIPTITSFTATEVKYGSSEKATFSWSSENTAGVNFQLPCVFWLTATSTNETSSVFTLPCGIPIFSTSLPSSGVKDLWFSNKDSIPQNLSVSLLPQNPNGTYDGTRVKQVSLVIPAPTPPPAPPPPPPPLITMLPAPSTPPPVPSPPPVPKLPSPVIQPKASPPPAPSPSKAPSQVKSEPAFAPLPPSPEEPSQLLPPLPREEKTEQPKAPPSEEPKPSILERMIIIIKSFWHLFF